MRKIVSALVMIVAFTPLFAQNIEDIKEMVEKGQLDKAKAGIDKYLANPKKSNDTEGWYFKGVIYNEIAKSDQYKSLVEDGRKEAFEAFKKCLELDPKNIRMTLEQHVRLFDLYNGYFDLGAQSFNNKEFKAAYENFKNALAVEEYIASKGFEYNGFTFPKFDTILIQNIALSAYQDKNMEEAANWYQKIADQKIGGKDFEDIYQFLVSHFNSKKDMVNREKYLAIGRELYPDNDYWVEVELSDVDSKNKKALFAKYDELLGKYPDKFLIRYNYAVELYNYTYTGEKRPDDYKQSQEKLESVLNSAIKLNSTPEANMLMSRHYYNLVYDLQDAQREIKGTKPEDVKKRNEIKDQMIAKVDGMLPYAQKAYEIYDAKTTLRPIDKGNFKVIADILASAYELKGDKAKADEYIKKRDSIE